MNEELYKGRDGYKGKDVYWKEWYKGKDGIKERMV
jgi:hypothetical protein